MRKEEVVFLSMRCESENILNSGKDHRRRIISYASFAVKEQTFTVTYQAIYGQVLRQMSESVEKLSSLIGGQIRFHSIEHWTNSFHIHRILALDVFKHNHSLRYLMLKKMFDALS